VTGCGFRAAGPADWLQDWMTREVCLPAGRRLGMLHCHVGPQDGEQHGEPVVAYRRIAESGLDLCLVGHPHTYGGIHWETAPDGRPVAIVEPGALVRGTLAEHDVQRQPHIMVATFAADGTWQVRCEPVPCRPAAEVLDLAEHHRTVTERRARTSFLDVLRATPTTQVEPAQVLTQLGTASPVPVLQRAEQFLLEAESELVADV
jgi:hypothetical protein